MAVKILSLLLTLPWLVLAAPALPRDPLGAHGEAPAPCRAPVRPPDDVAEPLWQAFLADVDRYRACIDRRVAAEQAAAAAHDARARQAADAWSRFVRDSLNAPQDYPWPAAPRDGP